MFCFVVFGNTKKMQKFYTKKTGAGERLVKLPLASLATLITVHRNLPIAVDEEEKDKDGLKAKLERFLQVFSSVFFFFFFFFLFFVSFFLFFLCFRSSI